MELALIGGFILLSAFFNGCETAFLSVNRIRLHSLLEEGRRSARILEYLYRKSENMNSTFVIAVNVSDVAIVIIFTDFLNRVLNGNPLVPLYVTLIITPVVAVFATLVPKVIFRELADSVVYPLSYLFFLFYWLLFPVQFLFSRTIKGLLSLIGLRKKKGTFTKDEFNILLDMTSDKGILKESEKEFIESIMNFKNVRAREIMLPLIRMTCVEENDTIEIAMALMMSTRHARLPVFRVRVDNMIGYIENKAIIEASKTDKVGKYVKQAIFVPSTSPINSVLVKLREKMVQMAFVVDEYGGVSGILTNQDIITEIVGEFVAIHEDWFAKDGQAFVANGMLDIEDLNDRLGLKIEKKDFETLGGFVLNRMEKIPEVGESFDYGKFTFEVSAVSPVRVKQVRIYVKKTKARMAGVPERARMRK